MDPDLLLVIGIVIAVLTVPSLLSALSDRRPPRTGIIMILAAGALIVTALSNRPGSYRIDELPDAFYRVFARYAG